MQIFRDDDGPYLQWVAAHADGSVVNVNRKPKPSYLIPRHANCRTITGSPANGGSFINQYSKVCAMECRELETWAREQVGANCNPAAAASHSARPQGHSTHHPGYLRQSSSSSSSASSYAPPSRQAR